MTDKNVKYEEGKYYRSVEIYKCVDATPDCDGDIAFQLVVDNAGNYHPEDESYNDLTYSPSLEDMDEEDLKFAPKFEPITRAEEKSIKNQKKKILESQLECLENDKKLTLDQMKEIRKQIKELDSE